MQRGPSLVGSMYVPCHARLVQRQIYAPLNVRLVESGSGMSDLVVSSDTAVFEHV